MATSLGLALSTLVIAPPSDAQTPPIGTKELAEGRYAEMEGLLEKTFLGVNVLRAKVRFGTKTAAELERLAAGQELDDALEEKIARVAYRAPQAYLRVRFLRDVDFDTFIESARSNSEKARDAGMISDETYRRVHRQLPRWFSFLKERGIKEGDWLLYRARPSSLRTVFLDEDHDELLDQTDRGKSARLAALGGYFAPGTGLREPLVSSLFEEED